MGFRGVLFLLPRPQLRRGDLSGGYVAVPSHHDDPHGGPVRGVTAGFWFGHWLATASSAGTHHRRRFDREPATDVIHNPRRLPLHGSHAAGLRSHVVAPKRASRIGE